ncbi:uncharacterized protein BO96DRAFT_348846 [Aspergillus niger CBS 101883]|uniref:Uncharacterized protein n=2 Tax=Aspergillus niger TaxID=5061 RepID=A2Q8C1_ASPNC|nr:uncharacterized protein BO96DRAFT_348846 [Aspergillus niger CBS 101883]XP_059599593.1 hypothetical protein An01g03800 [Aspergillus niger]PYH51942.1 hypothetical protein BO96DRAFT_348846 [Aspergillus niger CBS 101883]CAK36918.1 hypothetical protein An01g03800 [Aspergillus niger]
MTTDPISLDPRSQAWGSEWLIRTTPGGRFPNPRWVINVSSPDSLLARRKCFLSAEVSATTPIGPSRERTMIRNRRLSDKEVSQVMDWFVGAACRSAKSSMALWGADLMIALYQLLHYLLDPATNALGEPTDLALHLRYARSQYCA